MKVSIFAAKAPWGGAELHTIELSKILGGRGHDVSIVQVGHDLYSQAKFNFTDNIKLVHVKVAKNLRDLSLRECLSVLRAYDGDVCVFPKGCFDQGSWRFDFAARIYFKNYFTIEHLCADPMPPKASRSHLGGLLPGLGLWWYKLLIQRLLRSVGPYRIICVSDAVKRHLVDYCQFPSRKLKTIHNGVDSEKFQRVEDNRRRLRAVWGIKEESLVFGAVGRLSPQKGYDLAIELFGKLVSEYPERDISLVIVGSGPMLDELQSIALVAGVEGRVIFAGYHDQPWEVYSAFDAFIMPSLNEGLPLGLLEAMACNCCPIAMAVGGISEVISDPALGWLLRPGDKDGFYSAMREVVHSTSIQLAEMGTRGRAHIVSHFNAGLQYLAVAEFIEVHARSNLCNG